MSGIVYNKMYVHYDDTGQVILVSNVIIPDYRTFEIETDLILDFLSGKKSSQDYKIEYFFNLSKGIVEEKKVSKRSDFVYIIPETTGYENEITFEHNLSNRSWKIVARDDVRDKLKIMNKMSFFICEKDNVSFLYSTYVIDCLELADEDLLIKFSSEIEEDLKKISIVTNKKLNSYGIKEIK